MLGFHVRYHVGFQLPSLGAFGSMLGSMLVSYGRKVPWGSMLGSMLVSSFQGMGEVTGKGTWGSMSGSMLVSSLRGTMGVHVGFRARSVLYSWQLLFFEKSAKCVFLDIIYQFTLKHVFKYRNAHIKK